MSFVFTRNEFRVKGSGKRDTFELQKYQAEGKEKVAGKEIGKDKDAKKEVDRSLSTDNGKQPGDNKKAKAKDTKDLLPQKEGPGNKKGVKLN